MQTDAKIFVAGHRGMVGSAIVRCLTRKGYTNLVLRTHEQLDLTAQPAVHDFFAHEKPDYVILAAARVGGIHANSTYPADFIYQNLQIQNNVIHESWRHKVKRLLFLGSSCIYPRECPQPIREEYLLTGPLEKTNEPYAIAKIAGIRLCEAYNKQYGCDFISVMPTNLYGPHDNFHPENSHVPAALLSRFHHAKVNHLPETVVWGSGRVKREFLHVDDFADACLYLINTYRGDAHINVGTGKDITIAEFAALVADVVGYRGRLVFDTSRPDGTPRKVLDISRLQALGWTSGISLQEGLRDYYEWFLQNSARLRA